MKERLENLSKASYRPEFRETYSELEEQVQDKVDSAIVELVENYITQPWNHEDVKYLPSKGEVWRLKVGNRGKKTDHRVFLDIEEDGLVFLSVKHRDNAYQ